MTKKELPVLGMPNPAQYIVQAMNLSSLEVYRYLNETEEPVLQGISLDIQRRECWGIVGNEAFEVELLLEIIGCVRPYGTGRCILCERGMMRKKRRILPHVFYIADGDVTFPNMNTLEYLMFATAHTQLSAAKRQIAILERLLDTGLYYLTLAPIRFLSRAQKAVICLLAASFSKALLIIASVTQLTFDEKLSAGLGAIASIIRNNGGALLLGTKDCDMVQAACTHAAFLVGGQINHKGKLEDMLSSLDKRAFIVNSNQPLELSEQIKLAMPELSPRVFGQEIHIYDYRETPIELGLFMEILLHAGISIESLQTSRKTLENAYKEALTGHDL
jgi:ABC-2 type transport system ATP-binding protein